MRHHSQRHVNVHHKAHMKNAMPEYTGMAFMLN